MLTPKQEKFAKNIALEGMNYSDAYRNSYSCKRMGEATINNEAWNLAQNHEIAMRIKELAAQADTPKVMTAQKRKEWLTGIINDPDVDINARLKASDQLNKMDGEYIQKVEAEVKNAVCINIELVDD